MQIVGNAISRDWTVEDNGKTYHINYTNADFQTLALCNRNYFEVYDEESEELQTHLFSSDEKTEEKKQEILKNIELEEKLIEFCIKNFFKDIGGILPDSVEVKG